MSHLAGFSASRMIEFIRAYERMTLRGTNLRNESTVTLSTSTQWLGKLLLSAHLHAEWQALKSGHIEDVDRRIPSC